MRIKWLGHAAFSITASDGTAIITDPYRPGAFGGAIGYGPITDRFDVATVSHKHADHDGVDALPGSPIVVDRPGRTEAKGITFDGIATYHDRSRGSQRGENTVFCFTLDQVKVCHLGDLGHTLDDAFAAQIGPVDVLLIPVGGTFTIDAQGASQVVSKLKPKIVIPMHFKTPKVGFDLDGVERFTSGKSNVEFSNSSELDITPETLPAETKIVVLKPAR